MFKLHSKLNLLLLASVLLMILTGCNTEQMKKGNEYVSQVKQQVNEVVNFNRTLKEQENEFNCRDEEKTKRYVTTMDSLSEHFRSILKLQATDEFDKYDVDLKKNAKDALQTITQLKTLVKHAAEQGDDTFYQNEKDKLLKSYEDNCQKLRSLSSEIQTYWRNA